MFKQQCLYFLPLPQGQGSFLPVFSPSFTVGFKYDSLLKSNLIKDGIRKENTVLPSKFDTAKSPVLMTSIPMSIFQLLRSPSATRRLGNMVLLGRYKLTRYTLLGAFLSVGVLINVFEIGFKSSSKATFRVINEQAAPVSHKALISMFFCLFFADSIFAGVIRCLDIPLYSYVKELPGLNFLSLKISLCFMQKLV